MLIPVSEALKDLLGRQGMTQEAVGAADLRGIGAGLPRRDKTDPLTAQSEREVTREPILVWTNMRLTQRTAPRGSVRLVSGI